MTHRTYIKCAVCGSVIMVRTQVGWLPEHPVRIHCAKCGILISGMFSQDPLIPRFHISFENAAEVAMQTPDYCIEVSGELLTSKIRPYVKEKDEYQMPPFFKALRSMGTFEDANSEKAFFEFKHKFLTFLNFIKEGWPYFRRLQEIWLSGNHGFLAEQMRGLLPADRFPLNNELEYLRGLHQLFLIGFDPVLPDRFYTETAPALWEGVTEVAKSHPEGYQALTEYFYENGLLNEYEGRAFKILSGFVDTYPFLIPAIGLESYRTPPDLKENGTSAGSFEDVKHYYLECFEAIGEMIALVVAYSNLNERNDLFAMADSSFPTVKTLRDFLNMQNKGNKITFCETAERFNQIVGLEADNGLRNAIGHDSYSYDGVNQIVSYYPSGKMGKGSVESIYLIEFFQKALRQFYALTTLIELTYQTRKAYYVQHGISPAG